MAEYPDIERGTNFGDIPARQWQNLSSRARRSDNFNVGPGLLIEKARDGDRILLDPKHEPTALHRKRVVVIKEPAPGTDQWLEVKTVRYKNRVPRPPGTRGGTYELHGPTIQAYPVVGTVFAEFVGLAFAETDGEGATIAPDSSTAILDAYFEAGIWYVYPPTQLDRFVVCRSYTEGDDDGFGRTLIVQDVLPTLDEAGVWTGALTVVGDPIEMNVWPAMKAADFAPFLWFPADLNDFATILPVTFWHGTWWLKQRPKRPVSIRRGPLQLVDCQPVEE